MKKDRPESREVIDRSSPPAVEPTEKTAYGGKEWGRMPEKSSAFGGVRETRHERSSPTSR